MINFFNHNEIDQDKWDFLVKNSGRNTFFANYQTLSLANPHWCALVEDDYHAAMPLPINKKWGISYIYTPSFFSRGGLFSLKPVDSEMLQRFINRIPPKFKRIDLLMNERDEHALFSNLSYYKLSLNQDYKDIYKNFSENCKRNIKVAEKLNLVYQEDGEISEIITLFKENRGADKSIALCEKDYDLLLNLAQLARKMDMLDVVTVKNQSGNLLAGALILNDFGTFRFWFSGRDNHFSETRSMFFLLHKYLSNHSSQDADFDFNGSMNENVARFYKGFGANGYTLPYLQLDKSCVIKLIHQFLKQ